MKYLLEYKDFNDLTIKSKADKNSDTITFTLYKNNKAIGKAIIEDAFADSSFFRFEDYMSEDKYYDVFDKDFAVIQNIEIKHNEKKKGHGTFLLKQALNYIKNKMKRSIVYLNANPIGMGDITLNKLIDFYKRFGFKILKKYPNSADMILKK